MRIKEIFRRFSASLLAAVLFCLAADAVFAMWGLQPSGKRLAAVFGAVFLLVLLAPLPGKRRWLAAAAVPALCALALLASFLIWRCSLPGSAYRETDNGKAALYGGKNVLVVVPHEDDDLNLLGGVIEQYIKYGSRLRVAFLTNGDYFDLGAVRINEALSVYRSLGLPEENVIFLGYGDSWQGEEHLYNAPQDRPMTSHIGYTETYGTPEHPAYNDGNLYTHRHLTEDLAALILEYRPDVLYACDFDFHPDHQAASLFFEEAMGEVLAAQPDYRPQVFKGFAYSTAYYSVPDYYRANIASSPNPSGSPYMEENSAYAWQDRVRLPVLASTLSRSLLDSGAYGRIALYASQGFQEFAQGIVNGDKVFWVRDTGSVSYAASVRASSGQAWRLNDFKLADSDRLTSQEATDLRTGQLLAALEGQTEDLWPLPGEYRPLDGAWTPEPGDGEKTAVLELAEPADLSLVRLYGTPAGVENVLDAVLLFDGEDPVHTGPLDPNGGATDIPVDLQDVRQVSVTLLETEGEKAGLSEIELYSQRPETGLRYIKLQNMSGDFVYDYYIASGEQEDFTLYTQGCPAELAEDNYRVSVDGEGCAAKIDGGKLRVSCPRGKSCTVTVESRDGSVSDSAYFSNPSPLRLLGQKLEAFGVNGLPRLKNSTVWVNSVNLADRLGLLRLWAAQ